LCCSAYVENLIEKVFKMADEYNVNNLVFEGGGAKGTAYVGVLQALQELGFFQNGSYTVKK